MTTGQPRTTPSAREIRWLAAAPALIALALGGIYAIGAISIFGQFQAADLDAVQAMPLVPIDQILARGIGAIINQAAFGLLGISGAYAISAFEDMRDGKAQREGKVDASGDTDRASGQIFAGRFGVVLWTALLIAAFVAPFGLVTTIGAGFLTLQAVIPKVRNWMLRHEYKRWRPTAFFVGYCSFLVVAAVVGAFTRPPPLPDVVVERGDGSSIRGGLVATSGSNWFIAKTDGGVLSLSQGEGDTATVTYEDEPKDESLFQRMQN